MTKGGELEMQLQEFLHSFLQEKPEGSSACVAALLRDEERKDMRLAGIDWLSWHFWHPRAVKSKEVRKIAKRYKRKARELCSSVGKVKAFNLGVLTRDSGGCVILTTLIDSSGNEYVAHQKVDA